MERGIIDKELSSATHIAETDAPRGCFANGVLPHGGATRKPPRLVAGLAAAAEPNRWAAHNILSPRLTLEEPHGH